MWNGYVKKSHKVECVRGYTHHRPHHSPCEEEEEQTVDHLIFKCKKLRNQRKEMIRQIKNTGGNWPATSETLIKNYQKFLENLLSL